MSKKVLLFCVVLLISGAVFAAGSKETVPEGKVAVVVSFDAMKEFTAAVGQDRVFISTIIPNGMEAHDFEPKVSDLRKLHTAQMVVYSGLGMEPWMEEALSAVNNAQLVTVVASQGIDPIKLDDDDHDEHGHEPHGHDHDHGEFDPHTWLSLLNAQIMVNNIVAGLSKVDPANAAFYAKNGKAYNARLQALYNEFKQKLDNVKHRYFVTGHAAFGYLCRDFNLEQQSVEDVFASGEPSAKKLAKLVDFCKEHNITTIFVEEMVSPKVSQTLAREVGATVQEIYTIENAEDELSYYDRMHSNLEKIYQSLAK